MEPFGQVMLSHLNTDFLQNKQHDEFHDCYLDAVGEFNLFSQKKSVAEVIGAINRSLNSSRARLDGLSVLRRLLVDCDTDVFEQHCISWAGLLLTALQSHDQLVTWQVTCRTMTQLFRRAKSHPELSRELMGSVVPQTLTCLLQMTPERVPVAVRCLSDCLRCYPRTCAPFMNKIEAAIVPLMDRTEENIAEGAAECYSLLGGCGGAGSQGARHTELWGDLSDRVLGSLHGTINSLYDLLPARVAAANIRSHKTRTELQLSPVSPSDGGHCYRLQHRFHVLTRLLTHMLSEEFASVVKLPVRDILHVICRTLAVNPKMLVTNVSKEMVTLAAVLPALHVSALTLLTALIECATDVLLPHTSVINKLTTQSLSWSASDAGHSRLFGRVRSQVYDTVVTWLRELGTSSDAETVGDTLLPHILSDCSPHAGVVMRQDLKNEPKEPVAKKRRRHTEGATQMHTNHQVEPHADSGVCLAALRALHQLLISSGQFLQLKDHKKVHETIVPLLFKVTQQAPQVTVALYSSAPCRRALYRVLLSCVLVQHPSQPAPTQCALRLFTAGTSDPHIEVASFCREALVVCGCIVHPRAPSFYKAVTVETVVMTTKEEIGPVHYVGESGDAILQGGDRSRRQNTAQQLNGATHQTRVETTVSMDVTDVSMTSLNTSVDTSSVDVKPTSTPLDVSDSDSDSDDDGEETLPLVTDQLKVTMATVTGRGRDLTDFGSGGKLSEETERLGGTTERMTEERTTEGTVETAPEEGMTEVASESTSKAQEDHVTAMLGSFVDVQPEGSDSP